MEKIECPSADCIMKFSLKKNLLRHLRNQHNSQWNCSRCQQSFNRYDNYMMHEKICYYKTTGKRLLDDDYDTLKIKENVMYIGGALDDTLSDYCINFEDDRQNSNSVLDVLKSAVLQFRKQIKADLFTKKAIKFYFTLFANFHLGCDETFSTNPPIVLNTDPIEIFESSEIDEVLHQSYEKLISSIEDFQHRGSGWILKELLKIELHVVEYNPLRATSYIPLPADLKSKKAIVNIQNKDEKCFLWSVIAGTYMKNEKLHDPQRPTPYYSFENQFNLQNIEFPMRLSNIPMFERKNDVSISVYGYQEGKKDEKGFVYPLKVSREPRDRHVNLLLIADDNSNHYCYIKDFNKLLSSQYSSGTNKTFFCRFCLHGFSRHYTSKDKSQFRRSDKEMKEKLKKHEENCFAFAAQRTEFPDDPVVRFKNIKNQLPVPFVVYADFESILERLNSENKCQEHLACSFSYQIVSSIPGIEFDIQLPYVGLDAVDKFLDNLQNDLNKFIIPLIEKDAPMIWDEDAKEKFRSATHCHICKKEINREVEVIVRDHCHFTGTFRGAAHQECNLAYKIDKSKYTLPIVFHNLRGYDSHLLFQKIKQKHGKINVIPNNSERYISFTVGRLKFLDSMQFLSGSLEKLAKQLPDEQFHIMKKFYQDPCQRILMRKKGIYCYDYMDSMDKFSMQYLPSKEDFYSSLNGKHISDKDYLHAKEVWSALSCKTMKDYHDHYLITDVLLLTDIFENFRKMCIATYDLDPLHYYSLPGLSWDAMLKYTHIELDLITDTDMYQMVEKGMRGGISSISHRFATSNHPKMENYNPNEDLRTLIYQDANALYSWAMSQLLPTRNFKWKSAIDFDVLKIPKDSHFGYIVEVDLDYPKELHDLHNLYPLAPEHVIVTDDMLSPFQKENFPAIRGNQKKLIPNLNNKERYIVHYRNLQLYVSLGMKIEKIHRIIEFEQSCWMKAYIDLNTLKRKEAVEKGDKVGKDLFKLMNNAVFGKTMENLRKRINFELVTNKKIAIKRIAKPNFQRLKKFREDMVGIHMTKPLLVLNRPIQVGFAILDLSKYLMYDFHYNRWLQKFPNSTLLFTDTDSLAYQVIGKDIYKGMSEMKSEFDFSEYPKDHYLYSEDNMKVVGKFKDECLGQLMLKFIGLRPKLYSYDYNKLAYYDVDENGKEKVTETPTDSTITKIILANKNTAKGVKGEVAKGLSFDDYEKCLRTLKHKEVDIKRIGSDCHRIYTYNSNKIGLSAFDTKRWICADGIHTLAFGHWRTYEK